MGGKMRIKQSKIVRRFAFITNGAYEQVEFIKSRWPQTTTVNDSYKVVNYTLNEEEDLKAYTESLGYTVKELDLTNAISAISNGEAGPLICNHEDTLKIISHFNPSLEA